VKRGRLIALLIVLATFCCFPTTIKFANASSEIVKEIYTIEDFLNIETNNSAKYVLKSDIDFSGIGTFYKPFIFSGELDGSFYKLKNLNLIYEGEYVGLFSTIENATIKNLTIENFQIYGVDNSFCGTFAGVIENSNLENVNIKFSNNSYVLGGTTGLMAGKIINSNINYIFASIGNVVNNQIDKLGGYLLNSIINVSLSEITKPNIDECPENPLPPEEPDPPEEIDPPVEPDLPDEPEKPVDPVLPEQPDIPDEPEIPIKPENPTDRPLTNEFNNNNRNKIFVIIFSVVGSIMFISVTTFSVVIKNKFKKQKITKK